MTTATATALDSRVKLADGNQIPVLGLGVWDSPSNLTTASCLAALKAGYRHIDTAEVYGNESEVGKAIVESGVPRDQIFVTTKVYSAPDTAQQCREKLLVGIGKIDNGPNGYVDLMLIHNATIGAEPRLRLWREMEKLHHEGRIKSIGVSNFGIGHLTHLKSHAKVWPPAINQLELHPWLQQRDVVSFCHEQGTAVEAYCPLVRNQKAENATLKSMAERYGKATTQILVRYCLDKGWIPLPKSDNPERIRQNGDVFRWKLDKADIQALDKQPQEDALVLAVDNSSE